MTANGLFNILVYFLILLAITKPLGLFMANLFEGKRTFLHPVLRPVEKLIYRLCGIREDTEQSWVQYSASLLALSLVGFLFVYAIEKLQGFLPFNPMHFGTSGAPSYATAVTPDLAFNTSTSFVTNTNWQAYGGESTFSYFVQMAALAVQNFISPAVGICAALAFVRGFARHEMKTIGNFWVDLTRGVLYLMLPLCVAGALILCSQGVIQNFKPYAQAKTLEGAAQTIPQGPVASQEAVMMLGTNGGGFMNANAAHPYENPTPLSNLVHILMIFALAAGLTYMFGKMVGDTRQGWALFAACSVLFLAGVFVVYPAEQAGNPLMTRMGVQNAPSATQAGGNMEGKEVRFGIAASSLFAVVTTDASCGAVNAMHDSFTPLGGLIPLVNIQTDEVIFGGVGSGLYGILLYAVLAVFIAGLMVGRTPEYIGKKIEAREVKMAMLALLATTVCILGFSALTVGVKLNWDHSKYWNPAPAPALPAPAAATAPAPATSMPPAANVNNDGPHGFTEILYAYSSSAENNGSAFAGLSVNDPWYNFTLAICHIFGRFLFMIPLIAIGGSLAQKKKIPATSGTFPTHGPLFVFLWIGTVILIAALTFFPALSLGPIVEQFLLHQGKMFSFLPAVHFPIWS